MLYVADVGLTNEDAIIVGEVDKIINIDPMAQGLFVFPGFQLYH